MPKGGAGVRGIFLGHWDGSSLSADDGHGLGGREAAVARRRSFVSAFAQMQREAARASAVQLRAEAAARKEADRAHAAYLAARAADERERKRLYAESRAAEVAAANSDLDAKVAALESMLADTLRAGGPLRFSALKRPPAIPDWRHGYLEQPEPAPVPEMFMPPAPAGLALSSGRPTCSGCGPARSRRRRAHPGDSHICP